MVVDDDRALCDVVLRMLDVLGHRGVSFPSVETAVPHLSRQPVDVILLDLRLPGIEGISLLRKLRERDIDVPIVVMSGRPRNGELQRVLALEATFLAKPFRREGLEQALFESAGVPARAVSREDESAEEGVQTPKALPVATSSTLQSLLTGAVLPILDPRALEVQGFLSQPVAPSAAVVSDLVGSDPRLNGAILQRANSLSFRGASEVISLPSAVARLGAREVLRVVLEVCIQEGFTANRPANQELLRESWERSVEAAQLARRLCLEHPELKMDEDEAFTATLLHDVGHAYIVCAIDQGAQQPEPDDMQELLRLHHASVGAQLLESWGLPARLSAVARTHEGTPQRLMTDAALVALAAECTCDDPDATRIAELGARLGFETDQDEAGRAEAG